MAVPSLSPTLLTFWFSYHNISLDFDSHLLGRRDIINVLFFVEIIPHDIDIILQTINLGIELLKSTFNRVSLFVDVSQMTIESF